MMQRENEDGKRTWTRKFLLEKKSHEGERGGREVVHGSSSHFTPLLLFSTLVVSMGALCNGFSAGFTSPAQSGIMNDLGLTMAEFSVVGSITAIGGIMGALLCGKITDLIGRRGAMWLADIFALMGWLAIAFSEGVWILGLGRMSIGIAISLLTYAVSVYTAEISPEKLRGGFLLFSPFVMCCGLSIFFFLGNFINWRVLALIGAWPPILQILGLFFIPESPRWLAKADEDKGFVFVLQRLRGENTDISQEVADIENYLENLKQQQEGKFLDMFQRKYAWSLAVGIGLMGLQQICGAQGVSFYASSIFSMAGFSTEIGTTGLAIVQILTTGLGVLLMDRLGRRPLLIASAVGMCFGCLLLGMSFLFQDLRFWNDATPTLVFLGILTYYGSYTIGVFGIPWVLISEIFPMNIKASAGSLGNLVCCSGSWMITYTFNFMMEWSTAGEFFIFAGTCGLTALFAMMLVPETKGRTLEEIQISMTKSSVDYVI